MNDGNGFPPQGFANYDRPNASSSAARSKGFVGALVSTALRSPLIATGGVLLVGGVFAAIVLFSYPNDKNGEGDVPLIEASQSAFKETPEEPGGANIPFRDSTVFSSLQGEGADGSAKIENLLGDDEEPLDRFAVFSSAEQAASEAEANAVNAAQTEPASGSSFGNVPDIEIIEEFQSTINDAVPAESSQTVASAADEAISAATVKPAQKPFELTKLEKAPAVDTSPAATSSDVTPKAKGVQSTENTTSSERPKEIYAAGSSPETLDFVRSVLDKKDTQKVLDTPAKIAASTNERSIASASRVAAIEPAAGAAGASRVAISPGNYFVQLASVTSTSGAASEWGKLQKSYGSLLQNVSHRVKRADLEKGTFFRIQAGPMSKDSANALCDKIKSQKPGGCLVTK